MASDDDATTLVMSSDSSPVVLSGEGGSLLPHACERTLMLACGWFGTSHPDLHLCVFIVFNCYDVGLYF